MRRMNGDHEMAVIWKRVSHRLREYWYMVGIADYQVVREAGEANWCILDYRGTLVNMVAHQGRTDQSAYAWTDLQAAKAYVESLLQSPPSQTPKKKTKPPAK